MEITFLPNAYVIKKKANYLERIFCSLITFDNVYKLFVWNEELVESGPRLLRYAQSSPGCIRMLCCSHFRSYRTVGEISNRTKMVTKSLRPFKFICPCNRNKAFTSVYDAKSGYIGRVVLGSSLECILMCQNFRLKLFDHKDRHIYTLKFPAYNVVSLFGLYPWEMHDKFDIKIINKYSGGIAAVVRK